MEQRNVPTPPKPAAEQTAPQKGPTELDPRMFSMVAGGTQMAPRVGSWR